VADVRLAAAFLLVLLTVAAYLPVLSGDFVWDDDYHLTENPDLTAPDGLARIWSRMSASRHYPLTTTTFWIQRRVWGLDPTFYHAFNLLLHAMNAVLLLLVLRRVSMRGAFVAAAVWAVHPVNVESVAWITELKNTQSAAFFLLAVLCWPRAEGSRRWYALALLLATAAMLSKSATVILPAVLLLLVWWRRGRLGWADLGRVAPILLVAAAVSALAVVEQRGNVVREGTGEWSLGVAQRVIVAGKSLWFYAGKALWPARLSFVYPRWTADASAFSAWLPAAAAVAAALVLWWRRRVPGVRAVVFSGSVFAVALLPVLGFFDVYYFRYSFVADHFQYLAIVGPIALAVAVAGEAGRRLLSSRAGARAPGVAAAVVLVVLGAATWQRSRVFRSEESLWRDTVEKNPAAWLAQNNLGSILEARGEHEAALARFEKARELRPDLARIHVNVGVVLVMLGRHEEAVRPYREALRIRPDFAKAHADLGRVLIRLERLDEAIVHLARALEIDPAPADLRCDLGAALAARGRAREAVARYREVLRIAPDSVLALNNLAWIRATHPDPELRDGAEAVRRSERCVRLPGGRFPEALDTLAAAYARAGRFDEAVTAAGEGVDLARRQGRGELAGEIDRRRALYLDREPYEDDPD
jgi:tetratricopeptide (TPR) repeat protein